MSSEHRQPSALVRLLCTCALACVLVALCGCGGGGGASDDGTPGSSSVGGAASATGVSAGSDTATGADFTQPQEALIPRMEASAEPTIDTSGVASGYVGAAASSPTRLKFQVVCGDMAYNYDMPADGTPAFFPLNMGDGDYSFRIMQNIEGSDYAELYSANASVVLDSQFAPFLVPNVYCSYQGDSSCVSVARDVTQACTNEGEVVREVCLYVASHVSYDYDKAAELAQSSGYIPDPDTTLASGKGVCFDYASLSAAMLRSLGIPTQVVTGYVSPDNTYHAWIMVWIDGTWHSAIFDVKPNTWSRCDVTFASTGADQEVGDGTSYTDRYIF